MGKIVALFTVLAVWVLIPILCAYGWIMNIVKLLVSTNHGSLFIARCIGVIAAPLGTILGFVN